ncbi:unnamed protein product [Alopecurus aequalis]
MAVADAAVNPSPPPPPRIFVAVLVLVAARALSYLGFAISWVFSAGSAATVVARCVCRDGSAPLVFIEAFTDGAFKAFICLLFLSIAFAVLLLCSLCLVSLAAAESGPESESNKSAFGAITHESAQVSIKIKLPRAVVLGLVADLAFILLIVAGILVAMMSPNVEGSISQGEMIASVIVDVGIFGIHAISCFVIFPALALDIWRSDQAELTMPDC